MYLGCQKLDIASGVPWGFLKFNTFNTNIIQLAALIQGAFNERLNAIFTASSSPKFSWQPFKIRHQKISTVFQRY